MAAGRILANQIEHHLADALAQFKADGKLVLGICNGFQVMIKSGILLPPDAQQGPPATLTLNDSGKYEDRWVRLRVDGQKCVFFAGIESMYLPVAHGEGKFITRDAAVLEQLRIGRTTGAAIRFPAPPGTAVRWRFPTIPTARWPTWRGSATPAAGSWA